MLCKIRILEINCLLETLKITWIRYFVANSEKNSNAVIIVMNGVNICILHAILSGNGSLSKFQNEHIQYDIKSMVYEESNRLSNLLPFFL